MSRFAIPAVLWMLASPPFAPCGGAPEGRQDKPADNFTEVMFMARGTCHAGSKIEDDKAPGGFAKSDNFPKPLDPSMKVEEGRLQLIAEPGTVTAFGKRKGMRLLLLNATEETAAFAASDSRLSIVQEAKSDKGEWKPVEYLPSSW